MMGVGSAVTVDVDVFSGGTVILGRGVGVRDGVSVGTPTPALALAASVTAVTGSKVSVGVMVGTSGSVVVTWGVGVDFGAARPACICIQSNAPVEVASQAIRTIKAIPVKATPPKVMG